MIFKEVDVQLRKYCAEGWGTGELQTHQLICQNSMTEKYIGTGQRRIIRETREDNTENLRGKTSEKEGVDEEVLEGEEKNINRDKSYP